MSKLDDIALEIELTLISIIEGFALSVIAGSATPIVRDLSMAVYMPYVAAGMLFLLVFWSQSILHALSFIRWPTRVGHMFLYFLAAFVQVISFGNLTDPLRWFFWCSVFSFIILVLYIIDLRLIMETRRNFHDLAGGKDFIATVEKRHRFELWTIVPAAVIFNTGIYLLLFLYPAHFATTFWYGVFGALQVAVSFFAMLDCIRNFRLRAALVTKVWGGRTD